MDEWKRTFVPLLQLGLGISENRKNDETIARRQAFSQGGIIPVNLSARLTQNLKTPHEIFVGSPALCHEQISCHQNEIPVTRNELTPQE
jgi:hypothetical protein